MADYRTIPAAELGKGSNIKVELCETEVDLYWKMAIEVLELIQENNAKGEKTVMIVPYGPLYLSGRAGGSISHFCPPGQRAQAEPEEQLVHQHGRISG